MKYLLGFLEGLSDGPELTDPSFQQLLVDVQASKTQAKSADAFYESLEKIVNELKSTTESTAFQRPVSKREAPGYYEIIKRPMDLSTVLRNIRAHKYKNKAEFAFDLDLIWNNCYHYNTQLTHPLRASARFMKQKADHHLEFLADKNDRAANPLLPLLPAIQDSTRLTVTTSSGHLPAQPSPLRTASLLPGSGDEDAAGESDDAAGETLAESQSLRKESEPTALPKLGLEDEFSRKDTPAVRARSASRARRATSVASLPGDGHVNGIKPNGRLQTPSPQRAKLQTALDATPALVRSPYSMTHFLSTSLNQAGPCFSEKGKAKEILFSTAPPSWYPVTTDADNDELKLEGAWWSVIGKDEGYLAGLPVVPTMPGPSVIRKRRIPGRNKRRLSMPNGIADLSKPPRISSAPVSLEKVVHRSVDKLSEARRVVGQIQDFQRIEAEGGVLPVPNPAEEEERRERNKQERIGRKRRRKAEFLEAKKRRKTGGEIGETEAVMALKRTTASMLAHSGFEGANEIALDMFTRVAVDRVRALGRTLRLLMDGFSHKRTSEELILHALHENGQIQACDLETHIKDDIERESAKITEMTRKIRQAYKEVTTAPVIEDDMMFADSGEMLLDGNFAEELGEDFLGLRDLGIDKEHGMASLTVPSSIFYGRRKRMADAAQIGTKVEEPDYPPPPPFVSLNPATLSTHLPALLHAFYASRMDSGLSITEDDPFDLAHSQIGSLGQIIVKSHSSLAAKKKKEVNGEEKEKRKSNMKKMPQPGIGKGNWVRPSKEERERRAAQKKAAQVKRGKNGGRDTPVSDEAVGEDEDAEGEEE